MLIELSVENLAIVERARLELGDGFTVLTGETGAGKSLLVEALGLALGDRADTGLVRTGCERAVVAMVVDVGGNRAAQAACAEHGLEFDGGQVVIQREVGADGRSIARVGGRPTSVAALRALGLALVELHGQHEHQALCSPAVQRDCLDEWIGEAAMGLRPEIAVAFERRTEAQCRLDALEAGMLDREQRLDVLRHQVAEIESVSPQPGEVESLKADLERLSHAAKLQEAIQGATDDLAADERGAADTLARAVARLRAVERYDPSLGAALEALESAQGSLGLAREHLRARWEASGAEPGTLDRIADRLDALQRLRRKYGADEDEVLAHLAGARAELASLEDAETSLVEAQRDVAEADAALQAAAGRLSAVRAEQAGRYAALVESELRELAMPAARFEMALTPKGVEADGADVVEMRFSANPGEPVLSLVKVASGGEMSRLMLAIEVVFAGRTGVPTLIFDEIDSGLGGQAAATVARKLHQVSRQRQVIVISHLPQIACRADRHWRIDKAEEDGRTKVRLTALEGETRVAEIARMLAGEEVGGSALANARELLHQAS